jgi:hypothetical protein
MDLPRELTKGASLRGNEYAWPLDVFPSILGKAESLGFACLGGQFQFRVPGTTCEMYWLDVDAGDREPREPWGAYVARSSVEVRSGFNALLLSTNFLAEAQRWTDVPELTGVGASPEQYLCFVAYFIAEPPGPNNSLQADPDPRERGSGPLNSNR